MRLKMSIWSYRFCAAAGVLATLTGALFLASVVRRGCADTPYPRYPSDPQSVVMAMQLAAQTGGDWSQYLSERWRQVFTADARAALARAHGWPRPSRWNLSYVRTVRSDDRTAILHFTVDPSNPENPRMRHVVYLTREHDRWVIDSLEGTPEWAVPADMRGVYAELLPRVTRCVNLNEACDEGGFDAFVRSESCRESLARGIPKRMRPSRPMVMRRPRREWRIVRR